jgi:hypothetical protein
MEDCTRLHLQNHERADVACFCDKIDWPKDLIDKVFGTGAVEAASRYA